jgi:hypothetical protein
MEGKAVTCCDSSRIKSAACQRYATSAQIVPVPGAALEHLMEAAAGDCWTEAPEAAGFSHAGHVQHTVADPHPCAGCGVAGLIRSVTKRPKRQILHREVAAIRHRQHARVFAVDHHEPQMLVCKSGMHDHGVSAVGYAHLSCGMCMPAGMQHFVLDMLIP